jgi:protein-L-isoaspartate O-methyltransferase
VYLHLGKDVQPGVAAPWIEQRMLDYRMVALMTELLDPQPGGKLVIPVGEEHGYQELLVVEVDAAGEIHKKSVLPVRFVPLTRDR